MRALDSLPPNTGGRHQRVGPSTSQRANQMTPSSTRRARRASCCRASLAPNGDGLEDAQRRGLPSTGLPKSDWRSFRAYLVGLERSGQWRHDSKPGQTGSSSKLPAAGDQLLMWPERLPSSFQQAWSMLSHLPPASHLPTPPPCTTALGSSCSPIVKRPVHPSRQHAGGPTSAEDAQSCWAHTLAAPELGCVLVSRKGNDAMGFFHKTVILITAHDEVHGAMGLVLNKRTPLALSELTTSTAEQCPGFQEVFGRQRLHLGGPVHLDQLQLLHPYQGLRGAQCVADGLYLGGLQDAVQLVKAGLASPSSFMLTMGVAGWRPQQLQDELAAGYWHCVAAAPELLLPHHQQQQQQQGAAGSKASGGRSRSHSPQQHGVPLLQPPPQHPAQRSHCLWQRVMQAAQLL